MGLTPFALGCVLLGVGHLARLGYVPSEVEPNPNQFLGLGTHWLQKKSGVVVLVHRQEFIELGSAHRAFEYFYDKTSPW